MKEREQIERLQRNGMSARNIAMHLGRSASTVSREMQRVPAPVYCAAAAQLDYVAHCRRGPVKLRPDSPLWMEVCSRLKKGWSPQQISGRFRRMFPDDPAARVSHETIYCAIYAQPRGALRTELIAALRQAKKHRRPRSRGTDRRGQLCEMRSIHERPADVALRQVPGHWEGDLIKGSGNRSCTGTLVERKSRYLLLARMNGGGTADEALSSFARKFRYVPSAIRQSMTYDQGKEMAHHRELEKRVRLKIYFADPHSPWQRPSSENINGLLRQYLPKNEDLSAYTQAQLNSIAKRLNDRPRRCLEYRTPSEVFEEEILKLKRGVALHS